MRIMHLFIIWLLTWIQFGIRGCDGYHNMNMSSRFVLFYIFYLIFQYYYTFVYHDQLVYTHNTNRFTPTHVRTFQCRCRSWKFLFLIIGSPAFGGRGYFAICCRCRSGRMFDSTLGFPGEGPNTTAAISSTSYTMVVMKTNDINNSHFPHVHTSQISWHAQHLRSRRVYRQ